MWEDPIVAEVRRVRREIEEECKGDFENIHVRALEVQQKFAGKLVLRPVTSTQEGEAAVEV